ncbi:MAG: YlmC/YmxH family sporulation protein [Roseburia sp.]
MRFCELERKEVINVTDCKCLGNVRDLEFDECEGVIKCLIVPGPAKWLGCACREFELFIPWCHIVKIGPDIILVDIEEKECRRKLK